MQQLHRLSLLAGTLLCFALSVSAQPTGPNNISFLGPLTRANGLPLANGNYNLTFRFYDVSTGGVAYATSNVPQVPVKRGIASVPVPVNPAWMESFRYLGITVNAGKELFPRVQATAVPAAMYFRGSRIDLQGQGLGINLYEAGDPGNHWGIQAAAYADGNFGIVRYDPTANVSKSVIITTAGNVGIGAYAPDAKLDVRGTTRTFVLQITGGADLAEQLNVTDSQPGDEFKIEPGMVVSIDPSGDRKFRLSDEPYDRRRIGIISGGKGLKPGLVLRDEGNPQADGEQPIALTGQVWCHADTAFGPITPGDLLTTSSTPGHAMKVSDDAKARFTVLGQALTGLKEGRGWVQILVGKQ